MRILAIDFGEKKIGIAYAESPLAEPYSVIRYKDETKLFNKIFNIVKKESIEEIIVGLSEGITAEKTKKFAEKLSENLKIKVKFVDETLSTFEAQQLAIEGGLKRKKRKELEDAFAATIFLQDYLDSL